MKSCAFKFDLGQEVKDKITGYQGVIIVRAEYLSGCIHYGVLSHKLKSDGEELHWNWLDEARWEPVGIDRCMTPDPEKKPSGAFPCGPKA